MDTTNILFICGGAFDGLEKIIMDRVNRKSIGFGSEIGHSKQEEAEIFRHLRPRDLLRFGLIPEFIGRVPVVVALENLDEDSLVRILREPKNALIKQYEYLLALDGVKLTLTDDAVRKIAAEAVKRKTGARGLRSIMEEIMLPVMYKIPSRKDVAECIVTAEAIEAQAEPQLVLKSSEQEQSL